MQKAPHKAPQQQGQRGRSKLAPRELLSTRKGTMLVGVWAALVAAGVLVFFLNQYRHGVRDSSRPATVLVAKSLIEKGTSGEVIATGRLSRREEVPKGDIKQGAVTDPDALRGKVAGKSLYPGQQLTASSFTTTSEGVRTKLSGYDRAISVSVDASHGLIGEVEAGDHVDVLGGYNVTGKGDGGVNHPILRTLVQNVLVLEAPKKKPSANTGGGDEAEVTLRVTDEQAAAAAFTADNGKVWIALRPPTRAGQSRIRAVTLESLLVGLKPIELDSKGPER